MRLLAVSMVVFLMGSRALSDTQVRVRVLKLPLPLEIRGQAVAFKKIFQPGIQPAANSPVEIFTVESRRVSGNPVYIVRNGQKMARFSEKFLEIKKSMGPIWFGEKQLRPPLLMALHATHADIISSVDLNTYLTNVVLSEIPSSWPDEAIKAQSVATRTYTTFQMKARENQAYQLDASVLDQVYRHHEVSKQSQRIEKLVRETDNEILLQNGNTIKAYYHSDCGGHTEAPNWVWNSNSNEDTGTTADDHGPYAKRSHWMFSISLKELKTKLASLRSLDFNHFQVLAQSPTQRVSRIGFSEEDSISGDELRKIIGYQKIKSTLFKLKITNGVAQFSGKGFGHGSGLCQWGARSLADRGFDHREILRHYYPRAKLLEVHVASR